MALTGFTCFWVSSVIAGPFLIWEMMFKWLSHLRSRISEVTAHDILNVLRTVSLVRSQLESLEFFIDIKSFRSHYGPGVDSASNRNEYQEYFLGGKGGRCVRLTNLPTSCAVVMKSGNLNFLEHSEPLQACNGTDLPLPLLRTVQIYSSSSTDDRQV